MCSRLPRPRPWVCVGKSGSYPLVVAPLLVAAAVTNTGADSYGTVPSTYRAHHVHGGNEDARNGRR